MQERRGKASVAIRTRPDFGQQSLDQFIEDRRVWYDEIFLNVVDHGVGSVEGVCFALVVHQEGDDIGKLDKLRNLSVEGFLEQQERLIERIEGFWSVLEAVLSKRYF